MANHKNYKTKALSLLLTLAFLATFLSLFSSSYQAYAVGEADLNEQRVYDDAGVLSEEETSSLAALIKTYRDKNDFDFAIWITAETASSDAQYDADAFYKSNNFGHGTDKKGTILYLALGGGPGNRDYAFTVWGDPKELTENELDNIEGFLLTPLKAENYYEACQVFLNQTDKYFNNLSFRTSTETPKENTDKNKDLFRNSENQRVYDDANVLSKAEIESLESLIKTYRDKNDFDFAIWITAETASSDAQYDADAFYKSNNFGHGSNKQGTILYLALGGGPGNRDYAFTVWGSPKQLTERELDKIEEKLIEKLRSEEYNEACQVFLNQTDKYFNLSFNVTALLAGLTVSALAGVISVLVVKSKYKSKKVKDSYPLRTNTLLNMKVKQDAYSHAKTTSRYIPPSNSSSSSSGGGGGGRSSGGGSSSGRSGKF